MAFINKLATAGEKTLSYNNCCFVKSLALFRLLTLFIGALLALNARAEVRVLTSIKPLQLIAAAVQDGLGSPQVLLPPWASPHAYALRPSEVKKVAEADLFYWIGSNLETFLPRVLTSRDKSSVAVQELRGLSIRQFSRDGTSNAERADASHRAGMVDAHLWLLPANAKVIGERMAADLSALDPANAPRYQANLAAFSQRLNLLDKRLSGELSSAANKPFFVFHRAFDYFEAAYGIKHAGVFSIALEVTPGARQVAAMRERLQQAGPGCVFYEPPMRPRLAETLIADLPLRLEPLDSLGSEIKVGPRGYEALMEKLSQDLCSCLLRS